MENVGSVAALVAAGLLTAQALLVLVRMASSVQRHVPLLLSAFLLLASARPFAPPDSLLAELDTIALLGTGGSFLLSSSRRPGLWAWTGANLAVLLTLLVGQALGYANAPQYQVLRAFSLAALGIGLLALVFARWRQGRSAAALASFVADCAWMAGAGAALIARIGFHTSVRLGGLPELVVSLCTGWLVFQEGFPARPGWRGALPGLRAREGLEEWMQARLLSAEQALAAQDRIMAAGFLALGAAHEFKNTLSMIRLAAHHGLGKSESATKDACLTQILAHTKTAGDSAMDVLEWLAAAEGEAPQAIDAQRDLAGPMRRAGAALRAQGIVVDLDLGSGVAFRARRFDVEQILLNLIRNAADGYRRQPSEESQLISIRARSDEETAVIEVRDRAGGVPEELRARLFTASASGSGSTGLGLYLSRSLAEANAGRLEYLPVPGGSVFRLTLPVEDPEGGMPR